MREIFRSQLVRVAPILLGACLTACPEGNQNSPVSDPSSYEFVTTVKITSADSQAALEAKYQGRVSVYHPEDGFAIIATNTKPSSNDVGLQGVGENVDAWKLPEQSGSGMLQSDANANGVSSWASGTNVWSSGATTWSGGTSAWGSGIGVWAGGAAAWAAGNTAWAGGAGVWAGGTSVPPLPGENKTPWLQIGLPQAHLVSKKFGTGVKIAVIDTGIDLNHPALVGKLAPAAEMKDFIDGDTVPQEVAGNFYGHGTAVAGIITQIVPNAKILPIRVLNGDGLGNTDNVVKAIDHAILKGAQIINLSLGAKVWDAALESMIVYARSKNIYVVSSAGNNGQLDGTEYPARYSNSTIYGTGFLGLASTKLAGYVFGVGSVQSNDAISTFSNIEGGLHGFAPGELIFSLFPGARVGYFSGTSFAAPIYTGGIALAYGEMTLASDRAKIGDLLAVHREGDDFGDRFYPPGKVWHHGAGVINLERLLDNLPGFSTPAAMRNGNLIKNGSFESNSASDWNKDGATSVQGNFLLLNYATNGSKFVNLSNSGIWQDVTNLQPNTTYTLMASIRSSVVGVSTCLRIQNYGGALAQRYDCNWHTGFDRVKVQFTTGPNTTGATVRIDNTSLFGQGYVDDVLLFKSN